MSAGLQDTAEAETAASPTTTHGGRRWLWPVLVVVVTAAYGLVPYLVEGLFYQRGDTAVQFAPTWFHLGEMVRDGAYPPTLDPDTWQGGNYAAEGLHGVYNPLNVLIWVFVSAMPDLVVATLLVKVSVLVLLALGTYLLAREYDAAPWAAAAVATALPFSGFTLFWDAGSWPSGLMAFAYATWVWWAMRRTLRGVGSPPWAFLLGALAVTQGNPYGTLAVVAVGAGLVVEGLLSRSRADVVRLVLTGLCVACVIPLVFTPLLANSELAVRSGGALIENSGKMRPELGDLFGLSSPTYVPGFQAIAGDMRVPATYLAWFVLPLLPWLRYRVLRERARELAAIGVVGAGYLLMTIGPSKVWLFRWPVRLVEYGFLAVLLLFAVAISQGLARDRVRGRAVASGALVLLTAFLTFAENPEGLTRVLLGLLLVGGGTAVVLTLHLGRRAAASVVGLVLVAGTGVTVAAQVATFGENASSRVWHVPSDVDGLRERFAGYEGRTMQFADLKPLQNRGRIDRLEAQWEHFLPGSMYQVAGVEAVNSYSGLGLEAFGDRFCMEYDGLTKKCGYEELWVDRGNGLPPLFDQMKLETVVVQRALTRGVEPAAGWSQERSGGAVVLTRDDDVAWPGSRLSFVPEGAEVASATTREELVEEVELSDTGSGGTAVFAALGWEGWSATLDGRDVPVGRTATGLLTVDLPADEAGTLELTYATPGARLGAGLLGVGLLGALGLAWVARPTGRAGAAGGRRTSSRRRPARRTATGSPGGPTPPGEAPPSSSP